MIGLGNVAEPHLLAYRALENVELIGVVEPRADRLREICSRYAQIGYHSLDELLSQEKPDIACVLTPASTHRELTVRCAEAGIHVLCEKPMAHTLEDARAMAQACQQNGVQFYYGSSYRHLPAVVMARQLIRQGAIGSVRLLIEEMITGNGASAFEPLSSVHYPTGGPGGGGYGLVDHGIHMLDILPWLCDATVQYAIGRGDRTGQEARPEFALLALSTGAFGVLVYDGSTFPLELAGEGLFSQGRQWVAGRGWVGPRGLWDAHPGSIRVFGSQGALRIFHYANRLVLHDAGGMVDVGLPTAATPDHFGVQLKDLCRNIEDGTPPSSGIDAGMQTLKTLLSLYSQGEWPGGRSSGALD